MIRSNGKIGEYAKGEKEKKKLLKKKDLWNKKVVRAASFYILDFFMNILFY